MIRSLKKIATNAGLATLIFFAACTKESTPPPLLENKPVADFTFSPLATNALIINFTSTSKNATLSSWDFGEPNSKLSFRASNNTISWPYTPFPEGILEKTYKVKLVVMNAAGVKDSITKDVTIKLKGEPPLVTLKGQLINLNEPATFQFNATASTTSGANIKEEIDFGDGTILQGKNLQHTYTKSGTWTVTFTATNAFGKSIKQIQVDAKVITGIKISKISLLSIAEKNYDATTDPDIYFELSSDDSYLLKSAVRNNQFPGHEGIVLEWIYSDLIFMLNQKSFISLKFLDEDVTSPDFIYETIPFNLKEYFVLKYPATKMDFDNTSSLKMEIIYDYIYN